MTRELPADHCPTLSSPPSPLPSPTAITLRKASIDHNADDRLRPLLFLWIAAPAVGALALLTLEGTWSTAALALYFTSMVFLLAAIHGFFTRFHGRMAFHMSYWAYCFPVAIFAVASLQYDQLRNNRISYGIAVTSVVVANALGAILGLHTLRCIIAKKIFKPELKWGPLSLMPITHIAFRAGMMKMINMQKVNEHLLPSIEGWPQQPCGPALSHPLRSGTCVPGVVVVFCF